MINSINQPQANASEQSRMELQAKLNGLGGLNGRKYDPETKAKKLREACEGFESIFIQNMWKEMRNTVPKSNLLGGREEKFWQDMYDQELSKSMTSAGGIGLADMMYEQLSRNLGDASRGSAGNMSGNTAGGVFTPQAAPLINPQPVEAPYEQGQEMPAAANIYEEVTPVAPVAANISPVFDDKPTFVDTEPAEKRGLVHAQTTTHQPGSRESTLGSSGIDRAYKARREAGDKLAPGAVRPSMEPTRNVQTAQTRKTQATQSIIQSGGTSAAHGTQESLQAAIELAKTAGGAEAVPGSESLADLVAQTRLRNASNAYQAQNGLADGKSIAATDDNSEPVVTRTRYSSNIPKKNTKTNKKTNNTTPIRMLSVDNTSVNSKQGQGLAAYHAAQEAAGLNSQNPQGQAMEAPAAPIAPLTASRSGHAEAAQTSFAIPPLKSGDLPG